MRKRRRGRGDSQEERRGQINEFDGRLRRENLQRDRADARRFRIPFRTRGLSQLHNLEIDAVEDHLEVINALDGRISKLQKEIREISSEMEETQILMTIPGISYYSALTIIAEIATVERFPSSGHLSSYAGLVPSVKQSGSKETHGQIKGGRPMLRWILCQCAWNHVKNAPDSHITKFYERLKENKPKKLAIIAAARKLLKTIYWMLKLEEEFHPEGYDPRKSS